MRSVVIAAFDKAGEWLTQRAPRVDRPTASRGDPAALSPDAARWLLPCAAVAESGGRIERWGNRVAGLAAAWLVRLLGRTWRIRMPAENPVTSEAVVIGALWHRNLVPSAYIFRDLGLAIPVSRSRDGDRIAAVLQRLGFGPLPRGSSSSGGVSSLSGMLRALRGGHTVGILCDGPRGPARRAKPGVIGLARLSGLPIHPIAFGARPRFEFGSWDRAQLPLPFARVQVLFGEPIRVPRRATREDVERARDALDRALEGLEARAAAMLEGRAGAAN